MRREADDQHPQSERGVNGNQVGYYGNEKQDILSMTINSMSD